MSAQAPSLPRDAPTSVWRMYRALVGVGLVCGLLIVAVFELTRPVIERKRAEALRQAIFHVLPAARSSRTFRLTDDGRFEPLEEGASAERQVYAGYDDSRRLVGVAIETEGMGYQDVIRILYGYSPEQDAVVGIRVLESRETPGLGDRIESDPAFLANFERLDVSLDAAGSALAHPVEFVKSGRKTHPWQIDGITGATISSTAVAGMLSRSTAYWVPLVRRNSAAFEEEH